VGRVLEGVRVLDLTRVVAGPFATAILADLGAEIVKIERPRTGDDYRYGPSPKGETSLSFQNTNRGKRSITLDVRQAEGRDLLLRLCEDADALAENFRAGTMDGWGLGPDVLQERNPRLVVASLSGYGRTGPRAGGASYDIVAQASGGFLAITGFEDTPVRGGGALADFVGGLYLALGIVAGICERDRAGTARALDLSNQDCMFAVTDSAASIFHGIGQHYERVGNQHPFTAPYDCYPTRDGYMVVGVASNKLFRALMGAIGRQELAADERYKSHRSRAARRAEINAVVAGWMAERSCDEVDRVLGPEGADVPCTRVISPEEAIDDPQLLAREMVERHPHPSLGEVLFHGSPLRFEGAEARELALAPDLGEANEEVYGGLGLSDAELEALAEKGVI
jgi:CoA:oxalate CoA-transferase